jgi:phage terminase large subunit-like protein
MQKLKSQFFQVNEIKHGKLKTKEGRILALIPLYQIGFIYHRKEDAAYERELIEFPLGEHDDRIDAMSFLNEALFEQATDYEPQLPIKRFDRSKIDPY